MTIDFKELFAMRLMPATKKVDPDKLVFIFGSSTYHEFVDSAKEIVRKFPNAVIRDLDILAELPKYEVAFAGIEIVKDDSYPPEYMELVLREREE